MSAGEQFCFEKQLRPGALLSPFKGKKKTDAVYIRMNTSSQLEEVYELGPIIGEGSFGIVHKALCKTNGAKCAVKKIPREAVFSASERARLDREVSILRFVKHPGIIHLLAVAESPEILFLVTELCEGDSLSKCLEDLPDNAWLEEYIVVELIRQVASALSYLHNRGIVHRDLKANNIMLLHKVFLDYRIIEPKYPSIRYLSRDQLSKSDNKNISTQSDPDDRGVTSEGVSSKASQSRSTRRNAKQPAYRAISIPPQPDSKRSKQVGKALTKRPPLQEATVIQPSNRFPPPLLRTKLIDFGLAIEVRKNEEVLATACGTLSYMAPEVLTGKSYTRQCDVWSLGILIYHLLTKRLPYDAETETELMDEIAYFNIDVAMKMSAGTISPSARECLLHTLNSDPAYRYSASEILLDPWITQYASTVNPDDAMVEHDGTGAENLLMLVNNPSQSTVPTQTGSNPSVKNVLELMKQYRRELLEQKLETGNKK